MCIDLITIPYLTSQFNRTIVTNLCIISSKMRLWYCTNIWLSILTEVLIIENINNLSIFDILNCLFLKLGLIGSDSTELWCIRKELFWIGSHIYSSSWAWVGRFLHLFSREWLNLLLDVHSKFRQVSWNRSLEFVQKISLYTSQKCF